MDNQDPLKKSEEEIKAAYDKAKKAWDGSKFKQGFSLVDVEGWGKRIVQELDLKTWVVRLLLVGLVYAGIAGYWYWKGQGSKPANVGDSYNVNIPSPVEKGENLNIKAKDGVLSVNDKVVKAKDIVGMKPYGLQFKPFVTAVVGSGNGKIEKELGAGASVARFYKADLDGYITDKGFYIGMGYRLTDNCHLVGGYGKDYKYLNKRVSVGFKWGF